MLDGFAGFRLFREVEREETPDLGRALRWLRETGYGQGILSWINVVKSGPDEVLQGFFEIWLNYGIHMSGKIDGETDRHESHLTGRDRVYDHQPSSLAIHNLQRKTGRPSISRGVVFRLRSLVFHLRAVHIPSSSRGDRIE